MRSMIFAAVATLALAGAAHAAPPTATATATTMSTKGGMAMTSKTTVKTNPAKPRTAVSLACSGQADAKGVHGKDRTKFMAACKKAGPAK
jgi:hypothetical protein